jgi:hypothetical protein
MITNPTYKKFRFASIVIYRAVVKKDHWDRNLRKRQMHSANECKRYAAKVVNRYNRIYGDTNEHDAIPK